MFKFILSVIFAFSIVITSSAFGLYVLTCPDREKVVVSSSKDNGFYKAKGNIAITWGGIPFGNYYATGIAQDTKIGKFEKGVIASQGLHNHQIQCVYGNTATNNSATIQIWFTTLLPYKCKSRNQYFRNHSITNR